MGGIPGPVASGLIEGKKSVKRFMKRALAKLGFEIRRMRPSPPPRDFRSGPNDPRLIKLSAVFQPVLVDAPMELGRGLSYFRLDDSGSHPFVFALRRAMGSDNPSDELKRALAEYYALVRPASAAEYVGAPASHEQLSAAAPWSYVPPWSLMTLDERRRSKERETLATVQRPGVNDLPVELGWKQCGPASDVLIENEARRLLELVRDMERRGFVRDDSRGGDIRATALFKADGSWQWRVDSGEHRAAAAAALGHTTIPVRIMGYVDSTDADIWPNVMSGLYSIEAARAFFQNVFDGTPPAAFDAWMNRASAPLPGAPEDISKDQAFCHPAGGPC
jgi:hypothetical protein